MKRPNLQVHTYADPFQIMNMPLWQEADIRAYPHLCVSQTMVEGLIDYYGQEKFGVIATIESFLERYYGAWTNSPENDIKQFLSLSREIDRVKAPQLRAAMKFNQRELQDALRFICELEIKPETIDSESLSNEQKELCRIYTQLYPEEPWEVIRELKGRDLADVQDALLVLVDEQLRDLEKHMPQKAEGLAARLNPRLRRQKNKKEVFEGLKQQLCADDFRLPGVVLHGVHQFTPLIVRLIRELSELETEVILMFNYRPEFSHMYRTWERVYEWTGFSLSEPYSAGYPGSFTPGKAGYAMANILEGRIAEEDFSRLSYEKFDNLTTFADWVRLLFTRANEQLPKMTEQFYATDNENINTLLRSYFPKQFGEKHFLSYPVGQFILSLYNMWSAKDRALKINPKLLKECLAAGFFMREGMPNPVEIFNKVQLYFKDIETLPLFSSRLSKLVDIVNKIESGSGNLLEDLRQFPFFNVSYEELRYFRWVAEELWKITDQLFGSHNDGVINYRQHYCELIEVIQARTLSAKAITEKERELVEAIKNQLEGMHDPEIQGSIEDLKETIHFYLNRRTAEYKANWIVRNFEQLDGAVLINRAQGARANTIHLALVSDSKMKSKELKAFSWPLNDDFFAAVSDSVESLDVIRRAREEYPNFLRYSLFYAAYFISSEIKISYVENEGDREEQSYFMLDMLGIKPEPFDTAILYPFQVDGQRIQNPVSPVKFREPDEMEWRTFSLCPYRYLNDYLLERQPHHSGEFPAKLYFRAFILKKAWPRLAGRSKNEIKKTVQTEISQWMEFFPFWRTIDFYDLENQIIDDLNKQVANNRVKEFDAHYAGLRLNFLYARLVDPALGPDRGEVERNLLRPHLYARTHRFKQETAQNMQDFLSGNMDVEIPHTEVCNYCRQREVCLNYFLEGSFDE